MKYYVGTNLERRSVFAPEKITVGELFSMAGFNEDFDRIGVSIDGNSVDEQDKAQVSVNEFLSQRNQPIKEPIRVVFVRAMGYVT